MISLCKYFCVWKLLSELKILQLLFTLNFFVFGSIVWESCTQFQHRIKLVKNRNILLFQIVSLLLQSLTTLKKTIFSENSLKFFPLTLY